VVDSTGASTGSASAVEDGSAAAVRCATPNSADSATTTRNSSAKRFSTSSFTGPPLLAGGCAVGRGGRGPPGGFPPWCGAVLGAGGAAAPVGLPAHAGLPRFWRRAAPALPPQ